MSGKIKVCMVIAGYYPNYSGAEKQLRQLMATNVFFNNIDCLVLTRKRKNLSNYELMDGIPIYRVSTFGSGIFAALTFVLFSFFWLIKNRQKFDILHCHQLHSSSTIGILGKLLLKRKVISKVTRSGTYGELNEIERLPFARLRIKLLRSHLDKVIILNKEMGQELRLRNFSQGKIAFIPNGVKIDNGIGLLDCEKETLRRKLNLPSGKLLLYTGQMNRTKGISSLLKAWRLIREQKADAKLLLLGEINDPAIQVSSESDESIFCLGKVEDIHDYLKACDIFILPSLSEGMSNSLLEAMVSGLAIVATDIAGNRELIIDRKNGLLVKPQDIQGLAAAMLKLIEDEPFALKLAQQARLDVRQYDINRIGDVYFRLYHQMLQQT